MPKIQPMSDHEIRQLMIMRSRGDMTDTEFYRLMGHHQVGTWQFVRAYLLGMLYWRVLPILTAMLVMAVFAYARFWLT